VIAQIGIAFLGVLSIFLTTDANPRVQRWACIAGTCAQPFWFIATWQAQQWGIFALAFVYAAMWLRGVANHWVRPWLQRRRERQFWAHYCPAPGMKMTLNVFCGAACSWCGMCEDAAREDRRIRAEQWEQALGTRP
jgi:hypothetical protein